MYGSRRRDRRMVGRYSTYKTPRAGPQENITVRYFKTAHDIACDSSGNLSYTVQFNATSSLGLGSSLDFSQVAATYRHMRIEKCVVKIMPNQSALNAASTNIFGSMSLAICHGNYSGTTLTDDRIFAQPNCKVGSLYAVDKHLSTVWYRNIQDPNEDWHDMTSGVSVVNSDCGEILIWCDGPVLFASQVVATAVAYYKVSFKGNRYLS